VSKYEVPSYEFVEEKIREIDGSIIVLRIFYIFMHIAYKFQLIKNDKLCSVEIPRKLLEGLNVRNSLLEEELIKILDSSIQHSDCWNKI
jgi:5,10-methylenetetrahydrofolate reductase